MKFEHVFDTDHCFFFEWFTRSSIIELNFSISWDSSLFHELRNLFCRHTIEDWCCHLDSKFFRSTTEMRFKHLTDIHTRKYTERVQKNVNRRSIFHEWHIFYWYDSRNDTLVSMSSRHFITHFDFTSLSNIYFDLFKYTCIKVVTFFTAETMYTNHFTTRTRRKHKRRIFHIF